MFSKDDEYYVKLHREFKQIFKEIKKANRIVIYRHESPDFDALGTQMGLYTYIKHWWPEKEVHYVGDTFKTFIPRIFPEPEVLDESFYETPYLAIVVDTADTKRTSKLNLKNAYQVIKMDHHPDVEQYATISCVHPEMCAAAELVSLMLETMGGRRYPLFKEACEYLFIGIVGDSGRFRYPEVSPMSFRLTADLLATGINKEELYSKIYYTTKEEFFFKKFVMTNYQITEGGTCYYIIKDKDLKELKIEAGDTKQGISLFRDVDGIKAIVCVTEDVVKNEYRISLRSSSKPVNKVASMFNGGGHLFAAGARIKSLDDLPSLISEVDKLEEVK